MGEAPRDRADALAGRSAPTLRERSSGASRPPRTRSRARPRTTGRTGRPAGRLKPRCAARAARRSGHRQRWGADLRLLPSLGANAYRYSIEWSRIEPRPGEFDARGSRARAAPRRGLSASRGSSPSSRCHHYTHPLWFWREGGWENRDSVGRFARFAARVAEALSPRVRIWVTLNEPVVLLLGGYLAGLIPPGRRSFARSAKALEHMLRAHVEAASAIRARDAGARVRHRAQHAGLRARPSGHAAGPPPHVGRGARSTTRCFSRPWPRGACAGRFPGEGRARLPRRRSAGGERFVGVNYYSRVHLRFRGLPRPRRRVLLP